MSQPTLSRRELFASAALACAPRLSAAEPPPLAPLNSFPRMVQEWFVAQVRAAERVGNEARAALKTRADAERYVADVRKKIAACFGPFPAKTPLNPKVTGKVERDAYVIEKVVFESRPGFRVTANLYVPKGPKGPRRPAPGDGESSPRSVTEVADSEDTPTLVRRLSVGGRDSRGVPPLADSPGRADGAGAGHAASRRCIG